VTVPDGGWAGGIDGTSSARSFCTTSTRPNSTLRPVEIDVRLDERGFCERLLSLLVGAEDGGRGPVAGGPEGGVVER
jgi:hypothetical protein